MWRDHQALQTHGCGCCQGAQGAEAREKNTSLLRATTPSSEPGTRTAPCKPHIHTHTYGGSQREPSKRTPWWWTGLGRSPARQRAPPARPPTTLLHEPTYGETKNRGNFYWTPAQRSPRTQRKENMVSHLMQPEPFHFACCDPFLHAPGTSLAALLYLVACVCVLAPSRLQGSTPSTPATDAGTAAGGAGGGGGGATPGAPPVVANKAYPASVASHLFNPHFLQYVLKDLDDSAGPVVFTAPPDLVFTEALEEQVGLHFLFCFVFLPASGSHPLPPPISCNPAPIPSCCAGTPWGLLGCGVLS